MSTMSAISSMRDAAVPPAKSNTARTGEGKRAATPADPIANLYQQMDTEGKGSITRAQFQQAFTKTPPPGAVKTMGVEAAFNKLDPQGSGVVSRQAFIKGMDAILNAKPSAPAPATNTENKATAVANNAPAITAGTTATAPIPVSTPPITQPPAGGNMLGNNINVSV